MKIKATNIIFFGKEAILACDLNCEKAWGMNNRPRILVGSLADEEDFALLADGELGIAPADPGTYEGGYAKPTNAEERHNKWCARECERSCILKSGEETQLPDFSQRLYNQAPRVRNEGGEA
jgi:hypothetical protein